MGINWQLTVKLKNFRIEGQSIIVTMEDGRIHRVSVNETESEYILNSIIVRRKTIEEYPDIPMEAWIKNRSSQLVGFKIDDSSRLIAESWIPKAGLSSSEFIYRVTTLATEADRYEYSLTGRDIE